MDAIHQEIPVCIKCKGFIVMVKSVSRQESNLNEIKYSWRCTGCKETTEYDDRTKLSEFK